MTTPESEARLERAREQHQGDAEAYGRLATQMAARRRQLEPRWWNNRNLFARDCLIPISASPLSAGAAERLAYELENGTLIGQRKGQSLENLLLFAAAYQVEPGSIAGVLDGTDDLVPLPEAGDERPAPPPAAVPPPAVSAGSRFAATGPLQQAMTPYLLRIGGRLGEVRRDQRLGPQDIPSGAQMFTEHRDWDEASALEEMFGDAMDRAALAGAWDMVAAEGRPADEVAEACAYFLSRRDQRRGTANRGAAAGLTAAHGP